MIFQKAVPNLEAAISQSDERLGAIFFFLISFICAGVWGSMFLPCLSQICIPVGNALAIVSAYNCFLLWPHGAYCLRFCCKVYCLSYIVSRKLHAEISESYQEV